jgi:competence protein ComEC
MIEDQVTLLTADIGRETEFRLARLSSLDCDVLIVAHHGSRGSSSGLWLDRTTPEIAIIPAAPNNTYGHPHEAVLERLAARRIPVRWPARDGPCGATWDGDQWIPFP